MRRVLAVLMGLALSIGSAQQGRAETTLQLYLEGATYDPATETWVKTAASDGSEPIRLWAIGATEHYGTISDVKLAIAYVEQYDEEYGKGEPGDRVLDIRLTPSTTLGYNGFLDPSLAADPVFNQHGEGTIPTLNDGRDLPSHGEYGPGINWQEFKLGDFSLEDSPITDFLGTAPDYLLPEAPDPWNHMGQISVYEVWLVPPEGFVPDPSFHGLDLHFDLYNHVQTGKKLHSRFAPFSHDVHGEGQFVPAPPAYVGLIGMAIMGLGAYVWRRRRSEWASR